VAQYKHDRQHWAEHKARLEFGIVPSVPAPVVAQVSRSRKQVQLRRFLAGCVVVPLGESEAHEAGWLLARTGTTDVVDAAVAITAIRKKATILTSDPKDMARLIRASSSEITVIAI
jgi:predicted nucleic acid-binding protein